MQNQTNCNYINTIATDSTDDVKSLIDDEDGLGTLDGAKIPVRNVGRLGRIRASDVPPADDISCEQPQEEDDDPRSMSERWNDSMHDLGIDRCGPSPHYVVEKGKDEYGTTYELDDFSPEPESAGWLREIHVTY